MNFTHRQLYWQFHFCCLTLSHSTHWAYRPVQLTPSYLLRRLCFPYNWPMMLVSMVLYSMLAVAENNQLPTWSEDLRRQPEMWFILIKIIFIEIIQSTVWNLRRFRFLCRYPDRVRFLLIHFVRRLDYPMIRFVLLYLVDCGCHICYWIWKYEETKINNRSGEWMVEKNPKN